MKKWMVLFLCAAALCGCGGDEDGTPVPDSGQGGQGGGGETQQPVLPGEILTRRIASVDVTDPDDFPSTFVFEYDAEGRLSSVTENYSVPAGAPEVLTKRFAYEGNTVLVTRAYSQTASIDRATYWLENGRAVRHREEENTYWEEAAYSYDAAGYLAGLRYTFSDDDAETVNFNYTSQGCTMTGREGDESVTCTVEYDPAQLNNLNLDLYGIEDFCEEMTEFWADSRLLALAGPRMRYLPAKCTTVWSYYEDGKLHSETETIRYAYRMDGEYITEVAAYLNDRLDTRIVFHYE